MVGGVLEVALGERHPRQGQLTVRLRHRVFDIVGHPRRVEHTEGMMSGGVCAALPVDAR
ncbi:hypothetical protein Dsi01nite_096130 [Dactylosporangium siamense]|uniref:Uncharacterized protein n=1 Tax=Dactylosporangium siamense TaxID=685454 RepID=A0A919PXN6_9ACTN|nr:hypothetical protein Dsi01nite_096130 [Dactylosporangium siamense]